MKLPLRSTRLAVSLLACAVVGCGSPNATEVIPPATAISNATSDAISDRVARLTGAIAELNQPQPPSVSAPVGCGDDYVPTQERFEACRSYRDAIIQELEMTIADMERVERLLAGVREEFLHERVVR